jgi:hypothetical protein
MFYDKGKINHLFLKKIRCEWIQNHIEDVISYYKLKKHNWEVRYTFLSNKPLLSCEFSEIKINHAYLKNILLKYLRNLKNKQH